MEKKGHSSKVCSERNENAGIASSKTVRVSRVSAKSVTANVESAEGASKFAGVANIEPAMEAGGASKVDLILKEEDYVCFHHTIRCFYPWKCPHAVTKEVLLNSDVSKIANVVGESEMSWIHQSKSH